jgi:ABC-2 type transport system ATP-binding protein
MVFFIVAEFEPVITSSEIGYNSGEIFLGAVAMSMIETHGLSRNFGQFQAVQSLDLEVPAGEVLGFLGPNGAGKTTTIRMLAGIIAPSSGYAVIAGRRTDGPLESLHGVVGLLTETPGFYNRLSAIRNLEFYAGFYAGLQPAAQAEKYLKIMGLWERRSDLVGTFSKGMKQRLALARALIHEPPVLFLDEPTSGLDPEAAEEVRSFIKKLGEEGRTVFLSTHNLAEAEQLCQRIAIFSGHLIALDTPQNLRLQMFQHLSVVRLQTVSQPILDAIARLAIVRSVQSEDTRIKIELSDSEKELPEVVQTIVQAGGRVIEVSEERHSLEEIYLNLVREEKQK